MHVWPVLKQIDQFRSGTVRRQNPYITPESFKMFKCYIFHDGSLLAWLRHSLGDFNHRVDENIRS